MRVMGDVGRKDGASHVTRDNRGDIYARIYTSTI